MTRDGSRGLLADLVGFPTVAGTSNLDLVARVATVFDDAGATVTELPATRDDARNLHAVVGPADVPRTVLAAYSDVVGVDGLRWSSAPFCLIRRDERLYGRATADMKGFLAVAVAAMASAARDSLDRPVHLGLSANEELGCIGTPPLLDALGALAAPPSAIVVGEPTERRVATRHKGNTAWTVHVRGRGYHSSVAPRGVDAVAHAARLVVGIEELGRRLAGEGRDDAFAEPHATLSVGPIQGGMALNVGPDRCTFAFELRTLPGQLAETTLGRSPRWPGSWRRRRSGSTTPASSSSSRAQATHRSPAAGSGCRRTIDRRPLSTSGPRPGCTPTGSGCPW